MKCRLQAAAAAAAAAAAVGFQCLPQLPIVATFLPIGLFGDDK
jgi:hypothetical protein